jgi:hypothetical protein
LRSVGGVESNSPEHIWEIAEDCAEEVLAEYAEYDACQMCQGHGRIKKAVR